MVVLWHYREARGPQGIVLPVAGRHSPELAWVLHVTSWGSGLARISEQGYGAIRWSTSTSMGLILLVVIAAIAAVLLLLIASLLTLL